MKIVNFPGYINGIKIAQDESELNFMYDKFFNLAMKFADNNIKQLKEFSPLTSSGYELTINADGKVDRYLDFHYDNVLFNRIYRKIERYRICSQYAYDLLQRQLPYDVMHHEEYNYDGKKKKATVIRKRRIDMRNVLKTFSMYITAVNDVIKYINFKYLNYE